MVRILTIIDNPLIKKTITVLLQKLKIREISSFRKYAGFLKSIQYEPHAIIMELPTSTPQDLKLLQLIRKNSSSENKPIIVFGPRASDIAKKAILNYGADFYLETPLDYKVLFTKLNELIKQYAQKEKKDTGVEVNQISVEEIDIIRDPSVILNKKLDIMEAHIAQLLAFPTTVASVLKLTQDERSSAEQLGKVIESDSAVSAEILKLSNSVYYASRNTKITGLKNAIVRIGFEQAKKSVMAMSVMNKVNDSNYETGFNHCEFWFHSLAVAVISEKLAKASGLADPSEAYVFGLLHELGVMLYNEYLNKLFLSLLDESTEQGQPFVKYQLDTIKVTHFDLQARLFSSWNFSNEFVDACKALNGNCFTDEVMKKTPLATVISVADALAHSFGIGRAADCCVAEIPESILLRFGIKRDLNAAFSQQVFHSINVYNSVLQIATRKYPTGESLMRESDKITLILDSRTAWNPVREYMKQQGYKVINTYSEDDFFEQLEAHEDALYLLSSLHKDDLHFIERCKRYKGIIFDANSVVPQNKQPKNMVVTNYPVDLRNVDMVIHSLAEDTKENYISNTGLLVPVKSFADIGGKEYALIGHSLQSVSDSLRTLLEEKKYTKIESVTDGIKVANMAKTANDDIALFIVDHSLVGLETIEAVKMIKLQKKHKRGRFIILFKEGTLTDLQREKYQFFGVTDFVDYEKDFDTLKKLV